jgi:alkaline phosphatase D
MAERAPNRTVVLTGDIHSNWVNQLRAGFDRPDRPVVGAEFVATSISSGGDGMEQFEGVAAALPENPHVLWQNSQRGYLRCTVSRDEWRSDYRIVPWVTRAGAPIETRSSWRVERGRGGIERV